MGEEKKQLTLATRVVMLTALYFLGGLLGKATAFLVHAHGKSDAVTLVWPPSGIALAAILLFGYRFWPGIALGAVLFSFIDGVPFGFFTLGTAIGNTIGAIVCAFLLERFVKFDNAMERTRDGAGFMLLACGLGTTVNALFNVVSLVYDKKYSRGAIFPNLADLVGAQRAGGAGGDAGDHHLGHALDVAIELLARAARRRCARRDWWAAR